MRESRANLSAGTASEIMAVLRERQIRLSRQLGQNLLVDHNLLKLIGRQAELSPSDIVLEVGAGTGLLTRCLAEAAKYVVAVEIDRRLEAVARDYLADLRTVDLICTDALQNQHRLSPVLLEHLRAALREHKGSALKVVANLPFNITTPLIGLLLASDLPIERMILTTQAEFGERALARPGRKEYGRISVLLALLAETRIVRKLPRRVFWPKPNVDAILLDVRPQPEKRGRIHDVQVLQRILRTLFESRRKLAVKTLAKTHPALSSREDALALFARLGIPTDTRSDALSPEQILRIANALAEQEEP